MTEPDYETYLRDLDRLTPDKLDEIAERLVALVWAQLKRDRRHIDGEINAMHSGDPLVANLMITYLLILIGELMEHLGLVRRVTDMTVWRDWAPDVRRVIGQVVDIARLDLTAALPPPVPREGQP